MKKFILSILILIPVLTNAQIFQGGIDFGMSASQIDGDGRGGYHKLGPAFSVYTSMQLNDTWSIYSGVGYVLKGAGSGSKYEYFQTNLNYAEIPLVAEYSPFNNISFSAGLIYAYLIKGVNKTTYGNFDENYLGLLKNEVSSFFSLNYKISKQLTARFSYNYSLFPVTKYQSSFLKTNILMYYIFYNTNTSMLWFNNSIRLTLRYQIFSSDRQNETNL